MRFLRSLLVLNTSLMFVGCVNLKEPFNADGRKDTFRFSESGLMVFGAGKVDDVRLAKISRGLTISDVSKCVMASSSRVSAAYSVSKRHVKTSMFFEEVWGRLSEYVQARTGEKVIRRFGSPVLSNGVVINPSEKMDFQKDIFDYCVRLEGDVFRKYIQAEREVVK